MGEKNEFDLARLPECLAWYGEVVSGRRQSNKAIRQMAEREVRDYFVRQHSDDFPYLFDPLAVANALKFYRLLPFVDGVRTGENFDPEPWQVAWFASLSGWRRKEDRRVTRYSRSILLVPRKNGKTTMAAAMALKALIGSPPGGAEVYSLAPKGDTARLSIGIGSRMLDRLGAAHPLCRGVRIYTKEGIECERNKESRWWRPLSAGARSIEGIGASFAVVDEAAEIANRGMVASIQESGHGRKSPHTCFISTAQPVPDSPFRDLVKQLESDLDGGKNPDENLFGLIFTVDRLPKETDDELFIRIAGDEGLWAQANPSLDKALYKEHIEGAIRSGMASPGERVQILLKRFNIWVSDLTSQYIEPAAWAECGRVEEEGERGILFVGIDIGLTHDLTAVASLWQHGTGNYSAEVKHFAPRAAINRISKERRGVFDKAVASGEIVVMGENSLDMSQFISWLLLHCERWGPISVGLDPWMAGEVYDALEGAGKPVISVRQGTRLTEGIYRLERMVLGGRLRHGHGAFMGWQIAHCRRLEKGGAVLLEKGGNYEQKIDGVVALVTATMVAAQGRDKIGGFTILETGGEEEGQVEEREDGTLIVERPGGEREETRPDGLVRVTKPATAGGPKPGAGEINPYGPGAWG